MKAKQSVKAQLSMLINEFLCGSTSCCYIPSCNCGIAGYDPSDIRAYRKPWNGELYHPKHISKETRNKWAALINANLASLEQSASFDNLYNEVGIFAQEIKGIGVLATYDTALAISISMNAPSVMPELVYLQAGAAKGAKKLGITGRKNKKEVFVSICPDFEKLTPATIEHFLCCYKDKILAD